MDNSRGFNPLNIRVTFFLYLPMVVFSAFILTLFLSGADMALGRNMLMPIPPTIAAIVFLGFLAVVAAFKDFGGTTGGKQIGIVFNKNKPVLISFSAVVMVSLVCSAHPTAYWDEGAKWIFLLTYGFVIFLSSLLLPINPFIGRYFRVFPTVALLALVASMGMDVYIPGFFSTELARAAGFPGNSNLASVIMVLLCAASLRYDLERSMIKDFLIFAIGFFALVMTQSRSGALELLLLIGFYVYVNFMKRKVSGKKIFLCFLGVGGIIVVLAAIIPILMANSVMFQQHNTRFNNVMSSNRIDDGSSDTRIQDIFIALRLINQSPIIGNGTGYTRRLEEPPHNMYLNQWVNNGLFGVLSYLALLASGYYLFLKRGFFAGQALILVAALAGLFSHNMLDQRPFIMLFGMLLTLSLLENEKTVKTR